MYEKLNVNTHSNIAWKEFVKKQYKDAGKKPIIKPIIPKIIFRNHKLPIKGNDKFTIYQSLTANA